MEKLAVPQGTFELRRYPLRARELLRAWDAADEYLLTHLAEEHLPLAGQRILVLNDQFGALAVALADYTPVCQTDSYLSQQGTRQNLEFNARDAASIESLNSLQTCDDKFDLVLIKIPKSLALLEYQLRRLRDALKPDSRIVAAGMVRGIHNSTLQLFENLLGSTMTSLARKKARLVFSRFEKPDVAPHHYPETFFCKEMQMTVVNHAGVFSMNHLDIGTRLFLDHVPVSDEFEQIIDLGCGNGLLGIRAAQLNDGAVVWFVDESYMAVESARINFEQALGSDRSAFYQVGDCLHDLPTFEADLVLNNPPFHQQNAVGDEIAWQMFLCSRQRLRTGGELWVIGNRHLNYHAKLKRLFGNCHTMSSNRKFVILRAVR